MLVVDKLFYTEESLGGISSRVLITPSAYPIIAEATEHFKIFRYGFKYAYDTAEGHCHQFQKHIQGGC